MAKRILVVDDDENILSLERTILEQKGFAVTTAAGGAEALEILGKEDFDLVLLDVMMPEIDGFTVCRRIKEEPRTKEIPVIFLTAKGGGEALAEGFESGAIMYINKPFTANKLLTIVNTMLEPPAHP
ncbi:MAG: response regulator [Acidobacteriota bacterium]|jgi:DNA-binding response OmpR family regulator|nr:response regulator [Acidobacteriota bacterium]